ncbi:OsmC family protein [Demequina sp. TTPB684]|uniref:OsmC family protein n=1 Tax=unclassified Demequina TaxID=2620311 RepID=UPI001CF5B7B7|nr:MULTISPECIES: OsmC family protein [unclassified Demequina]MCB2411279.1 OsmC family protein [Demequina sp. TTPB684]UPU87793.1 OsmC family protein [Demequina sp. TMPB413]UPU87821.1 OsmC family protein [Demequina sp. TMPB413]
MTRDITPRSVTLTRDSVGVYTVTNAAGASLQFGRGQGLLSPVELLLASVAGCSSLDVDMMTTRRAEPSKFEVTSQADYVHDDVEGNVLENVRVLFDLVFPEGTDGDKARARVASALRISHDKECTVSRTIEAPTSVALVEKN